MHKLSKADIRFSDAKIAVVIFCFVKNVMLNSYPFPLPCISECHTPSTFSTFVANLMIMQCVFVPTVFLFRIKHTGHN